MVIDQGVARRQRHAQQLAEVGIVDDDVFKILWVGIDEWFDFQPARQVGGGGFHAVCGTDLAGQNPAQGVGAAQGVAVGIVMDEVQQALAAHGM